MTRARRRALFGIAVLFVAIVFLAGPSGPRGP
jgi:hypothetical protein